MIAPRWKLAAGNVDGDGYLDLIVGLSGASSTAFVYRSTGPNGLDTTASATLGGPSAAEFGQGVSAMDVNGDGFADATISASSFNSNTGAFYVFRSSGTAGVGSSSYASASTTVTGSVAAGDLGFVLAP